jgi:hypothetical protein
MSCNKNCSSNNIDFNFGTPNRFDLEEAILNSMKVTDNLNVIIEDVLEGEGMSLDPDNLVNTLRGIINLHTINTNKLWETFINLFQLDQDLENEEDEDYCNE